MYSQSLLLTTGFDINHNYHIHVHVHVITVEPQNKEHLGVILSLVMSALFLEVENVLLRSIIISKYIL